MELIQYMIQVFKDYYPWSLNYILVYEMPWVLNGGYKNIFLGSAERKIHLYDFFSCVENNQVVVTGSSSKENQVLNKSKHSRVCGRGSTP